MFGIYRLVLASMVAISHMGWRIKGLELGAYSVIGFYMLSGLLMHLQFERFKKHGNAIITFYTDRVLRVFPVYWAVCALALFSFGGTDLIQNFSLLPLSYEQFTEAQSLLFVAWSLATEFHFYLALPFLYLLNTKTLKALMWLSFGIFAASPFLPHSTWWAYYGMPGTVFVFIFGMLMARKESLTNFLWANILLTAVFVAGKLLKLDIPSGVNISVCIGVLLGATIIPALAKMKPKASDTRLGLMTLPLFLCHPVIMKWNAASPVWVQFLAALLLAVGLTAVIERPFDKFRYAIRKWLQGKPASPQTERIELPIPVTTDAYPEHRRSA